MIRPRKGQKYITIQNMGYSLCHISPSDDYIMVSEPHLNIYHVFSCKFHCNTGIKNLVCSHDPKLSQQLFLSIFLSVKKYPEPQSWFAVMAQNPKHSEISFLLDIKSFCCDG